METVKKRISYEHFKKGQAGAKQTLIMADSGDIYQGIVTGNDVIISCMK